MEIQGEYLSLFGYNNSPAVDVALSSDGSWDISNMASSSDISLPRSRKVTAMKICPPVEVKIRPATDKVTVVNRKSITAHVVSPTVTQNNASNPPICLTCGHQSDLSILSFDESYSTDVSNEPSYSSIMAHRHMSVQVDQSIQVDMNVEMNLKQIRAADPGGDSGNQTPKKYRPGNVTNARNYRGGDNKFRIPEASGSNRGLAKFIKQEEQKNKIVNVYKNNAVSTKPTPWQRKTTSYINRQAIQRETDRKNFILMKKLINVKARVSTFR